MYTVRLAAHEIKTVEPETYRQAIYSKDSKKWLEAMNEEMNSLRVNNTWILVKKPINQKLVDRKWIFKLKKARLMEIHLDTRPGL